MTRDRNAFHNIYLFSIIVFLNILSRLDYLKNNTLTCQIYDKEEKKSFHIPRKKKSEKLFKRQHKTA